MDNHHPMDAADRKMMAEWRGGARPLALVEASRELAVTRVYRGALTLALGLGVGLSTYAFVGEVGPLLLMTEAAAAALVGGGAIWAGRGTTHLMRYGRSAASLALLSLSGFGLSICGATLSLYLRAFIDHPVLYTLQSVALGASAVCLALLLVLTLVAVGHEVADGAS